MSRATPWTSLIGVIELSKLNCLNVHKSHPVTNAIHTDMEKSTGYMQSEADPELLIHVPFRQPVKLGAIKISMVRDAAPGDEQEPLGFAPKSLKLFVNRPSMTFADAESDAATQELVLEEDELSNSKFINLRYVKFQNVNHLCLFISENYGGDVTRIDKIEFLGVSSDSLDMTSWKPVDKDKLRMPGDD